MGMMYSEKYLPASRALARERQFSSGSGTKINKASLRLDAKSPGVQSNPTPAGSPTNRLIYFMIDKTTTKILQLEGRPRSSRSDAFNQDWSQVSGFANPPWCLIACCLSQVNIQVARVVIIFHLWPSQPCMVPINPGNAGGLPQTFTSEGQSRDVPDRARFHQESFD